MSIYSFLSLTCQKSKWMTQLLMIVFVTTLDDCCFVCDAPFLARNQCIWLDVVSSIGHGWPQICLTTVMFWPISHPTISADCCLYFHPHARNIPIDCCIVVSKALVFSSGGDILLDTSSVWCSAASAMVLGQYGSQINAASVGGIWGGLGCYVMSRLPAIIRVVDVSFCLGELLALLQEKNTQSVGAPPRSP